MSQEFDPEFEESREERDEEFERLLEEHLPGAAPRKRGELATATVVGIVDDLVLVSCGQKEESEIPLSEVLDPKGQPTVKPGDEIRVLVMGWDVDGVPQVSYSRAREMEAELMLEEAERKHLPVRGRIKSVAKGGLLVDVGLVAFMPASQVDLFRVNDLGALVGEEIEAYVLEYDPDKRRAVLSRRQLLEERREKNRQSFFNNVSAGQVLTGRVREVLDFGVFVQFEGAEGLIPRSELSYDRGAEPSQMVSPGQTIEVKVLDVTPETGRLTLSRKRLGEDPWATIKERFPVGATVSGKVVRIEEFGAFVQLEEGITGLIHVKDISWEKESKAAKEQFLIGDTVTCQVVVIDEAKRRIALSLKHLSRDPWMDVEAKYPIGSRHKGTVGGIRDFGAFVKLDAYVEGLLHIGDLSWEKRPNHPSEIVKEGDEIEVVVLKLDREQRRIGLGLKQLTDSPFLAYINEHPVGSVVTGKVSKLAPFGAFVELAKGVEGLVHVSELSEHRVDSADKAVRIGEEITVKILNIEPGKNRIGLSRKAAVREAEQDNIRQYMKQEQKKIESVSPFAAALQDAMKKKKK